MLSIFGNGSAETETSMTRPSTLLDTSVETDVCALGITEKSTSAQIVVEDDQRSSHCRRVSSDSEVKAGNVPTYETQKPQTQQLFDFVHIRYHRSSIHDGARIFRLAFEQTKPGGWIEVVETGVVTTPALNTRQQQFPKTGTPDQGWRNRSTPETAAACPTFDADAAALIIRQLQEAGFVDVEQKGWPSSPSSAVGICHKIAGVARYLKSWCLGFLGVRWNCDASSNIQDSPVHVTADEKGLSSLCSSSRVFVIARHP